MTLLCFDISMIKSSTSSSRFLLRALTTSHKGMESWSWSASWSSSVNMFSFLTYLCCKEPVAHWNKNYCFVLSPLLEIGGTWQKYPQLYKSKLTHLMLQKLRNFTSISFWPGNLLSSQKQRKCKLAGKFRWCTLRPKFGPNLQASCRQLSNSSCSRCKLAAEKTQGLALVSQLCKTRLEQGKLMEEGRRRNLYWPPPAISPCPLAISPCCFVNISPVPLLYLLLPLSPYPFGC